jgi:NAD+ kinase
MKLKFKRIALIGKEQTPHIVETLQALIEYLKPYEAELVLEVETAKLLPKEKLPKVFYADLKKHADLLIVVGGDGSILNAAPFASLQDIPVIGINRGRLGFLTDILPHKIESIASILQGDYSLETRFLLRVEAFSEEVSIGAGKALNDIVLLSETAGYMEELEVYIDDKFMCTYSADGLIISTPTGSTAHALSGGGPILHPNLQAIVLVPMLSHNLSSRPIVIDSASNIKLVVSQHNRKSAQINCDGKKQIVIPKGGYICIKKAEEKLKLLHPKDYDYFETLRSKLHWEKQN